MPCSYGPRPSDRKTSFSEHGRLQCDVKLATFATRQRGKSFAQVSDSTSFFVSGLDVCREYHMLPQVIIKLFA